MSFIFNNIDILDKLFKEEKSSRAGSMCDEIPKTTPELSEKLKVLKQKVISQIVAWLPFWILKFKFTLFLFKANEEYKDGNLNAAIELFNSALDDSRHPLIVSNRMIAYLKRKW